MLHDRLLAVLATKASSLGFVKVAIMQLHELSR
jgi:hypothetical protein